jgi:hypothetical protein
LKEGAQCCASLRRIELLDITPDDEVNLHSFAQALVGLPVLEHVKLEGNYPFRRLNWRVEGTKEAASKLMRELDPRGFVGPGGAACPQSGPSQEEYQRIVERILEEVYGTD